MFFNIIFSLENLKLSAFTFFIRKESNKETLHGFGGKAYIIHLRKYVTIFSKSLIKIIFRGKLKQLKNN